MFEIVIGCSEDPETSFGLEEVLEQCRTKLGGKTPKAGILFADIDFDHQMLLDGILSEWPELELVGGTTNGEISSEMGFGEGSLCLTLFCSDRIDIKAGLGRSISKGTTAVCKQAMEDALSKSDLPPVCCFCMPASLTTSGVKFLRVMKEVIGKKMDVFGGFTGDHYEFQKSYQYFGNEVLTDALPILVFSGPVDFSFGVAQGWEPIGTPGIITKAEDNKLYTIDDSTALDFYRNLVGRDAVPRIDRCLAYVDDHSNISYLTAPVAELYSEEDGSICFFGDLDEGQKVQLTVTDKDGILGGAATAAELAMEGYPSTSEPKLAFMISCAARKYLLGTRIEEEHKMALSKLNDSVSLAGFYAFGEIHNSKYHNVSCVIALIGERE